MLAILAQTPAMPLTRLADLLAIERSALARNLKPLERKGYVAIKAGEDRRARVAVLTRRGTKKLQAALPIWSRAHERFGNRLGAAPSAHLATALNFVIQHKSS